MYDALTQEQKWGFQYAAQVRNQHNATRNESLAEGDQPFKTNWTAQEIAAERLAEQGNNLGAELELRKVELMVAAFKAASPTIQAQVQQLLGVQDILQ